MPDYHGTGAAAVPYRCLGRIAAPYAVPMDLARERRRFFRVHARNQGGLDPTDCTPTGPDDPDFAATRKRHMATALLGTLTDERDYAAHMDDIHFNPVKPGLVKQAQAWEYASFRRCVSAGLYPLEWGGTEGNTIYGAERE